VMTLAVRARRPCRNLPGVKIDAPGHSWGVGLDVHLIDPVVYFEMIWLLDHGQLVLTDSGGLQKQAFFFGKACVTMRDQTEWVELVDAGVNVLVGADRVKIVEAASRNLGREVQDTEQLYGGGAASKRIAEILVS